MNSNNKITVYKESFLNRIKQKIKSIFIGNKETIKDIELNNKESVNKEKIMDIYNCVKNGSIDLRDIEQDNLYKIMILLKEEIEIANKKIKEELKQTEVYLYNIKMYNKELELLKKNS